MDSLAVAAPAGRGRRCADALAARPPPLRRASQVLHARTCTGTERQLVHLVAACHLIFSVGCDNMHLALDMLPPLRAPGGGGGTPRGWMMPLAAFDSGASLGSAAGERGTRSKQ